jgi:ribosomal protein S18 acetylase RimI-like enzyme
MKMEVRKYQESDFDALYRYWQRLGEKIPYFFQVTADKWHECLFTDQLDNESKFLLQETYVATESELIVGFIQGVQPAFAWNEKGEKYLNPPIGIIRHFYYDEGPINVADKLFSSIEPFINQFQQQHAFYHIFGMSCNAHHGKLHESLAHVDQFLIEKGYRVEHENLYYSLDLQADQVIKSNELGLVLKSASQPDIGEYEICLQRNPIGMIQIRFLDKLTGGATNDIVYMTWIGIDEALRRKGWGCKAMDLLIAALHGNGYRQLHLDTASTNETAQQFYEHYGFDIRGGTRNYIKATS